MLKELKVINKLAGHGAARRNEMKNDRLAVSSLRRKGFLKKVRHKSRVFYELTEEALPVLNLYRLKLNQEAQLRSKLYPRRRSFYEALLGDPRFLDTSKKEARDFLFLGDWRILEPPVRSQLLLSQYRFYKKEGVA